MTSDVSPAEHRRQAISANNETWDLIGLEQLTAAQQRSVIRGAYAAAYHWENAEGAAPENEARAIHLIGSAWLRIGRASEALGYAERCLVACTTAGLADFDVAFAHELRAAALHGVGRTEEARAALAAAEAVDIADDDDREVVKAQLDKVRQRLQSA